jgi:prepilin-type N-terminal cleavage/methylation domain-containing protein
MISTLKTPSWIFGSSQTKTKTNAIRRKYSKSGFTLVELLVVIVILAALVGLGLQRFGAIREAATAEKNRSQAALLSRTYEHWQNAGGGITAGTVTDAASGNAAARAFLTLMTAAPGTPTTGTVGTITLSDRTTLASQVRLKNSNDVPSLIGATSATDLTMTADGIFTISPTFNP